MKNSVFSMLMICFFSIGVFSQTNLNEYKYVVVSKKYDFLKEADMYQLNSLSKFLFNKYGFEALMEGEEYPDDLIKNRCLALDANILKGAGMFKTKLNIELTDCNDKVVYVSTLGESREKDYKKAYTEAVRKAFKSIEALDYKYEPKENYSAVLTKNVNIDESADEIKKLKEELESLKQANKEEVKNVDEETVKEAKSPIAKVESKPIKHSKPIIKPKTKESFSNILYAQELENGFQLVDSSPKVVYRLIKTGVNDVFLVEGKTAIIYKTEGKWVLESLKNGNLGQEILNVRF